MVDNVRVRIPFNKPSLVGRELEYIADAVDSQVTAGGGKYTDRAQRILQESTGESSVFLTTSCTAALEMSALMLDLGPGDSVIVPSFTFVTSALAFARTGAQIKFADIEPTTLGIDPESVARLLDDSVKAIVAVHYAGVGCDLAGLQAVLRARPDVAIIEDNAHGLFGSYRGQNLGTFGRFSTLSFHETKNMICGEGGALVVNNPADVDRAWMVYHKGTDRHEFLNGRADKYTWRDIGSSFALSDLLAAYLTGQLEEAHTIQALRKATYERYDTMLRPRAAELGVSLPEIPEDRDSAYHMYYILLDSHESRDRALAQTNAAGIGTTFHYVPLHSSPAAARFGPGAWDCPVSTDISRRLLRLPFFNSILPSEIEEVVDVLIESLTVRDEPSRYSRTADGAKHGRRVE